MGFNMIIPITIAIIIVIILIVILISKKEKPEKILEQVKPDTEFLEKSRKILVQFKQDAQSLFRYGSPGESKKLFDSIPADDQKRLLYMAFIEGDSDIRGVAEYFTKIYYSNIGDLSQFSKYLRPEDKTNIIKNLPIDSRMKEYDQQRITNILSDIYPHICLQDETFSFWILIPKNINRKVIVVRDTFLNEKQNVNFDAIFSEDYIFQIDVNLHLEKEMVKCAWILHIHNHTGDPNYIQSDHDDIGYVNSWKDKYPRIAKRMLFFLIEKNIVIEYDEKSTYKKRWIIVNM